MVEAVSVVGGLIWSGYYFRDEKRVSRPNGDRNFFFGGRKDGGADNDAVGQNEQINAT